MMLERKMQQFTSIGNQIIVIKLFAFEEPYFCF